MYVKYLREFGFTTNITTSITNIELSNVDVVHFINLDRPLEIYAQLKYLCHKNTTKLKVLSPIHHDNEFLKFFNINYRGGIVGYLYRLMRSDNLIDALKNFIRIFNMRTNSEVMRELFIQQLITKFKKQIFILENVDVILPLTNNELFSIEKDFNISLKHKSSVIPNGIDEDIFSTKPNLDTKDGILCVGRIEPRKNQLKLIELLAFTGLKLRFVGGLNWNNASYNRAFLSKVSKFSNVSHIDKIAHEDIATEYNNAKLHVSGSYFEVFPLVDLEAGVGGCNIIATSRSAASAFFKCKNVSYIDPVNLNTSDILRIYYHDNCHDCRDVVMNKYTWKRVTAKLAQLYQEQSKLIRK